MRIFIICILGVVLGIILTSCGTTTTLTEITQKTQKEEVKERVVYKDILKDSIVYRERFKNDTIYIEQLRFKTREVHDTSFIYFAVSDTIYVDKMVEKQIIKEVKRTPVWNWMIIGALIIVILYLTIKKL